MTRENQLSRRKFLGGVLAGAAVVGFDPVRRMWMTAASSVNGCEFSNVPPLQGVLLTDAASRAAVSTDKGNIVQHTPCAVLQTDTAEDIAAMIGFCREHNIKVACRGQGHTTHGQGLSTGLVIENRFMNTIHSISPAGADVDAGVRWKDLVIASAEQGLTPPVLTGYTNLSIGGTLSVGGISPGYNQGAQVDHVQRLEIVTGRGEIRECSPDQRPQLFEAALAGLGQCGIITRATVDLVPAKQRARQYNLLYTDNHTFFSDLRTLLGRGELKHLYNLWFPDGAGGWIYNMLGVEFYDTNSPPDDAHLLRGLNLPPSAANIVDTTYLDYILNVDNVIDFFIANFDWNRLIKPWFDVWMPDSTIEQYVGEVVPALTPLDVGPLGFMLLFPERRSHFTRPAFRVPPAGDNEFVYLFDILTASPTPGPNQPYIDQMLARNRTLFERARELGGTRYPIGALDFDRADWVSQYGEFWTEFERRKAQYDPDNILTPGAGIF